MARGAVVLAAGRGERLWPLTATRPKPLVPLPRGETLLSRILGFLEGLVDALVVVVAPGRAGEMVRRHVEERWRGPPARFAVQERPLGTGHAALVGLEALPRSVDEALIVYGDLLLGRGMVEAVASAEPPALAAVESREPWNYGVVDVDARGCLRGLREKPPDAPPGSLVNAGVYLVPRWRMEELLRGVKPSPRGELEITDAVARLAGETCFHVVRGSWTWLDVGRPWDLFRAYRLVFEEEMKGRAEPLVEGEVEPSARLKGPVYVAPDAVVRGCTVVEGPAWIEGEAGPLARIREWSFLLQGSKAGGHVEVKGSILMRGAKAPHLNYVGDSILGEDVNLGAGTVTANLRFDHATVKVTLKGRRVDTGLRKLGAILGDHAQTGVNVSTLPGARIGAYSWIHPGAVVGGDVADCSFLKPGGRVEPLPRSLCPGLLGWP